MLWLVGPKWMQNFVVLSYFKFQIYVEVYVWASQTNESTKYRWASVFLGFVLQTKGFLLSQNFKVDDQSIFTIRLEVKVTDLIIYKR